MFVVGVGGFRSITELGIDCVSILVIAHLFYDGFFLSLFVGLDTRDLPCRIVMIGNHLPIGIGHGAYAVPAVVRGAVDIGAHVGGAHHHRAHRFYDFALVAVVIGFASRCILHQLEPSRAVEEVLEVEHLAQPLVVVGVGYGHLVGYPILVVHNRSYCHRELLGAFIFI